VNFLKIDQACSFSCFYHTLTWARQTCLFIFLFTDKKTPYFWCS